MYKLHQTCRACGYSRRGSSASKAATAEYMVSVFNLGLQPLANDFCDAGDAHAGFAPLEVLYCPNCSLAQLSVTVDPKVLYSKYSYVTSQSQTMRDHFHFILNEVSEEVTPNKVLEIGSNDGVFLKFLLENGASDVLGIDPAKNLGDVARKNGIPTITALFDRDSANEAVAKFAGGLDLIVARHVFCHIDNWTEFMDCALSASSKETLLEIEVPYAQDMLDKGEFDTIYHEHLSYFTVHAMERLCRNTGWKLHKVVRASIHGGSLLVMLRRLDSTETPDVSVKHFLDEEECGRDAWHSFDVRTADKITELKLIVGKAKKEGKRVAAYGASAKATVLINACGFTRGDIDFVTDTTPYKQYKFVPGTNIPIIDPGALMREQPDLCLLTAWNFAGEILHKEAWYAAKGHHWIIPSPNVEVI